MQEEFKKLKGNVNDTKLKAYLLSEIIELKSFNKALIAVLKEKGIDTENLNEKSKEHIDGFAKEVHDELVYMIIPKE